MRKLSTVAALAAVAATASALAIGSSLLASPTPASRASTALDDPTIVAIFDAANTADIETGQLAEKKASTKKIRDFAAMLVRDHKAVRQQGRDLAKKLRVTPTPPKDDQGARDHAAAMTKLRGLRGKAFDKAFLEHEVAFHKAVIDAVTTTLLPAIKNAEVKALVVKVAPAFEAHMIAARNLEDR